MAVAANKRSVMTLFSSADDMYSHQVRIVLAEKGVSFETTIVEPNEVPEELAEHNPTGSLPTLVDRELSLYNAGIIMEYLDERFPHPPLMPVYPVARGFTRLTIDRIKNDWYSLAARIYANDNADQARKDLRESLLSMAPLFEEQPFFMNEEFSLIDCVMAPLLWRLPSLGVELNGRGSKEIKGYMVRLFERESFKASLTEAERELTNN